MQGVWCFCYNFGRLTNIRHECIPNPYIGAFYCMMLVLLGNGSWLTSFVIWYANGWDCGLSSMCSYSHLKLWSQILKLVVKLPGLNGLRLALCNNNMSLLVSVCPLVGVWALVENMALPWEDLFGTSGKFNLRLVFKLVMGKLMNFKLQCSNLVVGNCEHLGGWGGEHLHLKVKNALWQCMMDGFRRAEEIWSELSYHCFLFYFVEWLEAWFWFCIHQGIGN